MVPLSIFTKKKKKGSPTHFLQQYITEVILEILSLQR